MTQDKSCLAVAEFMYNLRTNHLNESQESKSTPSHTQCTVWDVLDTVSVSERCSPCTILDAVTGPERSKLLGPALSIAKQLTHQSHFVLASAERQSNSSYTRWERMLHCWDSAPAHSINRWMNVDMVRESAPLWVSLTRNRVASNTVECYSKRALGKSPSISYSCIELSVLHEQRCAADVLEACAAECVDIGTNISNVSKSIQSTVSDIITEHTNRRASNEDCTPIERLEQLIGHRIHDKRGVLSVMRDAVNLNTAVVALGHWLHTLSHSCIESSEDRTTIVCEGTLSVIGRLRTLGHSASHVVVARIAAAAACTPPLDKDIVRTTVSDVDRYLLEMVTALNDAAVVAVCLDTVLVELDLQCTNVSDLWTAIGDELSHTLSMLQAKRTQLVDLVDVIQSVAYIPPASMDYIHILVEPASRPLPGDHRGGGSLLPPVTSQPVQQFSSVVCKELYNFRDVVISDSQSHGLLSTLHVSQGIRVTFDKLAAMTNIVPSVTSTRTTMNTYAINLMRMALFMAPPVHPARVVSICSPHADS
jgi:hypothetical protein